MMNPGDIVFSIASSNDPIGTKVPRTFITAGQYIKCKIFGGTDGPNVPIVHAAIATGSDTVIESIGDGISATNLTSEQLPRNAMIFAPTNANLGMSAAVAASQFYNDTSDGFIGGKYSIWKAMLSIFKLSNTNSNLMQRINTSIAVGEKSFCSQFVANSYEVGNLYISANIIPTPQEIFPLQTDGITPWELAALCEQGNHFRFAGFWENGTQTYF